MKISLIKKVSMIAVILLIVMTSVFLFYSQDRSKIASAQKITTSQYDYFDTNLISRSEKTVLLFKARWCSTCVGLEKDIEENLDKIPEDMQILKVDFDSAYSLRLTYKVTVQHTLVQIDSQGKAVKTWHGSQTLDEVVEEVI